MDGSEIIAELDALESSGAPFDDILSRAVDRIHESDPLFHWTGIYELFPDGMLRLGPFVGAPTEHVFIAVGRGVCGSAVAERCNKNIADVSREPNYLACSSSTRSELVVLICDSEAIYAQIDIDSHELDAFGADAEERVQQVADYLAGLYARHRSAIPSTGDASGI